MQRKILRAVGVKRAAAGGWDGQLLIFAFKMAHGRRVASGAPALAFGTSWRYHRSENVVDVMCKMCRAGHQLENRVVIAREALRILALGVLSVMTT